MSIDDDDAIIHDLGYAVSSGCPLDFAEELQVRESD
jgi:hypothetical protein